MASENQKTGRITGSKRRRQPFSLATLLGYDKNRINKKKKKAVSFFGFDSSHPPAQAPNLYPRCKYDAYWGHLMFCWEEWIHGQSDQIVMNLLMLGLGYQNMPSKTGRNCSHELEFDVKGHQNGLENNFINTTDVDGEGPHFFKEGVDTFDTIQGIDGWWYMGDYIHDKRASEFAWWNIDLLSKFDDRAFEDYEENKGLIDSGHIWDELVMPIAFAFVHQTDWCPSLRRFRKFLGPWLLHFKTLIWTDEFTQHLEVMADDYFDNDYYFWSGWETACNHGCIKNLFINKLEGDAATLGYIIEVLESLFPGKKEGKEQTWNPKEAEDVVQKRVWEMWVIDWIRDKGESDYIRLYESEGSLLWYKEYIVPEEEDRQRRIYEENEARETHP